MITTEQIKELRDKTSVSVMVCKKALEEAQGDMEKALLILKREGLKIAEKKSERSLNAGVIEAYVHATKQVGVLVELRSETDFVARSAEFQSFAHNIAMHVAASAPADVAELARQQYIKNDSITIEDYLRATIQQFGENIEIARFVRYQV